MSAVAFCYSMEIVPFKWKEDLSVLCGRQDFLPARQKVGAGKLFSVAIVFVCMEFESWLIAGIESLLGKPFSDGRKGFRAYSPRIAGPPQS